MEGPGTYPSFSFFQLYSVVSRESNVYNSASSFCCCWLLYVAWQRLGDLFCILKSHGSLCVSFSRTDSGLYIYHLFVWSNLNFLHSFQRITLPTQSCLVLHSFCANLLHSCCFVASYLFLLWYDCFLWHCFVLLLEEIQFLS